MDAPRARRSFKTALILTTLAGALMVPFQLHNDIEAQLRLPAATQAAQQAIALLKSTNGPAICEDLLQIVFPGFSVPASLAPAAAPLAD